MKAGRVGWMGGILALMISLTCAVPAQERYLPTEGESEPSFSAAQLDQLLSPIALYPDPLLAQILMASTYPLEVVAAARWVRQPGNAALKGNRLAAALEPMDWDPSVKSLVPFPRILQMMDERLDWMEQLGDAFLAQPDAVTNSVQRLRHAAYEAGTLQSNPQQVVTLDSSTVTILPANPEVVYVPVYDPRYVYGAWWYPAYPPFYIYPPGYVVARDLILFTIGVFVVRSLWDWHHWDWRHRRIQINATRFNSINVHRPGITTSTWQHDAFHRRGVPYRDPRSRQRFEGSRLNIPEPPRSFRGYVEAPGIAPPRRPEKPAPRAGPRPHTLPPQRTVPPQRPSAYPQRALPVQPQTGRTTPPAFEGIGRGHDVRREERRGRASIQAMPRRSPGGPVVKPPIVDSGRAGGGGGRSRPDQPRR